MPHLIGHGCCILLPKPDNARCAAHFNSVTMGSSQSLEWFKAIGALSWPLLTIVLLLIFRKPLSDFIKQFPTARKVKLGQLEIELRELAKKGEEAVENISQLHVKTERQMDELAKKGEEALDSILRSRETVLRSDPASTTDPRGSTFTHVATQSNTQNNYTDIDNPLTNKNPKALLIVTQNWSPQASKGQVYNPHSIGVWYTPEGKWSIFNQDKKDMPIGAAFNVHVL